MTRSEQTVLIVVVSFARALADSQCCQTLTLQKSRRTKTTHKQKTSLISLMSSKDT